MMYKKPSKVVLAILFGMIVSITSAQSKKTKEMTQEQQNVLNAIQEMTNAFQRKDIDRVMESYEPNAVVVFEPESPVTDSQVLREMFIQMSMVNPKFTYSGHEVFIAGNIATHIAPWTMKGTAPDGSEIQQSGLSVAILRKQKDGKWLMIIDNPHGQFLLNK